MEGWRPKQLHLPLADVSGACDSGLLPHPPAHLEGKKYGFVVADFSNPFTGGCIQPVIEIKKEDFRVISGSVADQKLVKEFKDLFRNK